MKKKVLAIVSAATLFMMSTMPVLGATSVTVINTTNAEQKCDTNIAIGTAEDYKKNTTSGTNGFTVNQVDDTYIGVAKAAVADNALKDVIAFASNVLQNDTLKAAAKDSNKKIEAEVLSVVDMTVASTVSKDANGNYVFELGIKGVKEGDIIYAMHDKGTTTPTYEKVEAAAGKDKVTITSSSCSPFVITRINIYSKTTNNNNSNSTTPTSPKTGEAVPAALLISLAGLIGTAVCLRKVFGK